MAVSIKTLRTQLKQLEEEDVTTDYVQWLNDTRINQYLESRFVHHTVASVRNFVNVMNNSDENYLFGIFVDNKHIGNIKLGSIDQNHLKANIGLMIGNPDYWRQGFAAEVINAVTSFAFKELGLKKVDAGCYESNVGSKKAFMKSGFEVEGFLKSHVINQGRREGVWLLGKTPDSVGKNL